MDSQSRAFETMVEVAGTPLRCPRPMAAQVLQPLTASHIAAALVTSLVPAPQLVPALSRRRA